MTDRTTAACYSRVACALLGLDPERTVADDDLDWLTAPIHELEEQYRAALADVNDPDARYCQDCGWLTPRPLLSVCHACMYLFCDSCLAYNGSFRLCVACDREDDETPDADPDAPDYGAYPPGEEEVQA